MTYLVGYSPHKEDGSAIALACQFARSEADRVHALTVVPCGWETAVAGDTDRAFQQWAAQEGEASSAAALALLAQHPDVLGEATWVSGRSVPQAILEATDRLAASLVVVGSGENGPPGRVTATSKTDRLLHSAQVPVAIAPRGYRADGDARITRVTMGFRDDDASWTLLDQVSSICLRVGASLRLVTFAVRPQTMVTSAVRGAELGVFQQWLAQARSGLDEAAAHLRDSGFAADAVTTIVSEGASWAAALASVDWASDEVLVVGSSSTHRLAQVFLGSSAAKILRNATVPVVVVP